MSIGVLPTIFPSTHICASTGVARRRSFPASLPAVASRALRLVSSGGGPEEATKWGETPEPPEAEPAAPADGNFTEPIALAFAAPAAATEAETEVVAAVSATA